MGGRDPPQAPPVVTVGGETHGPVEEKLVSRLFDGAVGESGAVQDLFGGVRFGGDDETREP